MAEIILLFLYSTFKKNTGSAQQYFSCTAQYTRGGW